MTTGFAGENPEYHGTRFTYTYRVDQVGDGFTGYTCLTCGATITAIHRIQGDNSLALHGYWHANQGKP